MNTNTVIMITFIIVFGISVLVGLLVGNFLLSNPCFGVAHCMVITKTATTGATTTATKWVNP